MTFILSLEDARLVRLGLKCKLTGGSTDDDDDDGDDDDDDDGDDDDTSMEAYDKSCIPASLS